MKCLFSETKKFKKRYHTANHTTNTTKFERENQKIEKEEEERRMRRRKQVEVTYEDIYQLDKFTHEMKLSTINKVIIPQRLHKHCRTISFHSNWLYSVTVSSNYTPILIRTEHEDDMRYRVVGVLGGSGPSIIVFDIETGKLLREIHGHESSVYSVMISQPLPESRTFPVIVSGSQDGLMKVWDLQTGVEIHTLGESVHTGPVKTIFVYEGLNPILYSVTESTIWMWLLESGDLITSVKASNPIHSIHVFRSHEAFQDLNNPSLLIAGTSTGVIQSWSLDSYEIYQEFVGHKGPVLCLTTIKTEHLKILISGGFDWNVKLWNILTSEILYSIVDPSHQVIVPSISILFTPKIGLVIGYNDGTISVVDITTAIKLFELHGHQNSIKSISCTIHPRPFIVSCSTDSTVKIWDLPTAGREEIESFQTNHIKEGLENGLQWKPTPENKILNRRQFSTQEEEDDDDDDTENEE